jgi:hypothetical protein
LLFDDELRFLALQSELFHAAALVPRDFILREGWLKQDIRQNVEYGANVFSHYRDANLRRILIYRHR